MRQQIIFLFLLIVLASSATAQQDTSPAGETAATPALRFDADHRSRFVYWDEGLFPDDGWVGMFSRHRTRAGVTWTPSTEWQVRAVLANEFFSWYRNPAVPDFTLDEIFFDNLYIRWTPGNLPLTITAGRQNMRFGDGFIIMDGGPLDGSRSIYFNALRADVQPAAGHNISLFAVHQPEQDDILPRISDAERELQEAPIDAAGFYYSTTNILPLNVDVYYLAARSEHDFPDALGGGTVRDILHTPGLRLTGAVGRGFHLTAEGAYQGGTRKIDYVEGAPVSSARRSWAWHASLRWNPAFAAEQGLDVEAGYYQYSGGVLGGEEAVIQDWNPLFGRWPIWSESFIYTLLPLRGGIAYWSNVAAPFLRVTWRPAEAVSLRAMLQQPGTANLSRHLFTDHAIGTLAIVEVRLNPGKAISGHVLLERMWYTGSEPLITADSYWWGRVEVMYRWQH